MADIVLTKTQAKLARTIQGDLEKFGSALVPAQTLRQEFAGEDASLLAKVMISSGWMPKFDPILDVTRIIQVERSDL